MSEGAATSKYFSAVPVVVGVVEVVVVWPPVVVVDDPPPPPVTVTETEKLLNHIPKGVGVIVPLQASALVTPLILKVNRQLALWAGMSRLVKFAPSVPVL